MNEIENNIYKILKKVFKKTKIPKNFKNLKINDLEEWDSLGNFNLLLAIEDYYKVKFSLDEISKIKSIREILDYLKKHNE
jgi:acyl carrier protein